MLNWVNTRRMRSSIGGVLCLLAFAVQAKAGSVAEPGSPRWVAGTMWNLVVTLATPDKAPDGPKKTAFALHVIVTGLEKIDGEECWKLMFVAGKGAPKGLGPNYHAFVSRRGGWTRKLKLNTGPEAPGLVPVGNGSFVETAPKGFPLELFPLRPAKEETLVDPRSLRVVSHPSGDTTVWEATYTDGRGKEVRVRQVWAVGEGWWREYDRFVDGRKDLSARRPLPKPPASLPPTSGKRPSKRPPPDLYAHMLRIRPELQALVTVVGDEPDIADMLQRLRDATGVPFSVAPNLKGHSPSFGSVQMRNASAWSVMELIAHTQLKNGRWERVGGGFRLTGEPLKGPPRRARAVAAPPEDSPPGDRSVWYAISLTLLAALGLTGLALLIRRRRAASQPGATA